MWVANWVWVDGTGSETAPQAQIVDAEGGAILGALMAVYSSVLYTQMRVTNVIRSAFDTPVDGSYNSCADAAVFRFRNELGEATVIVLPGPVDALFLGDTETVDIVFADPLITAMQIYCLSPSGNPIGGFQYGVRRRLPVK